MRPAPRAAPGWVTACGDFLFKYRNAVFPAVFAVLVIAAPRAPWTSDRIDDVLDIAGIAFALAGQALRSLVIGLAYIKRGGLNKKVYANALVTDGIFSACRNPLYVGNALILSGLLMVCNAPSAYLVAGGFFILAYWVIVRTEETFLLRTFGESYVAYCREVNRFLPNLRRIVAAMREMPFSWRRVVMKDYSTVTSWVLALVALAAYEEALRGSVSMRWLMASLAVQVGIVLASSGFIRWLKKSGRLREAA